MSNGSFKVGDRVRYVSDGLDLTEGKEYTVVSADGESFEVIDDVGDINATGNFETVSEASDELAELRAFRDRAIERYPDLAGPETDEQAASRLSQDYLDDMFKTAPELAAAAIAWARANPR